MIKLSFKEPVFQETTTAEGLKKVVCTLVYRAKGIECHGGKDFVSAIGISSKYRKSVGEAVCDPHDTYDLETGKRLALSRARDNAYLRFQNTIKEKHAKYGQILARLEEAAKEKTVAVRSRNKEYRTRIIG